MKKPEFPESRADDHGEEESFLHRWRRLKAEAVEDVEPPPDAPGHEEASAKRQEAAPEPSSYPRSAEPEAVESDEPKGDEDMPSFDTIDQGGSVADFFSPRVSQELRRAALRRLFAQSELPVMDELDDYAGDYTKFTEMGGLVTNEMRHRIEVARQRLAKRVEERLAASADSESEDGQPEPRTIAVAEQGDDETGEDGPDPGETDDQEHSDA